MHTGKLTVWWISLHSELNTVNCTSTLSTLVNLCFVKLLPANAQVFTWPETMRWTRQTANVYLMVLGKRSCLDPSWKKHKAHWLFFVSGLSRHGCKSHKKWLPRCWKSGLYPKQWTICCGMSTKGLKIVAVSVRKMTAQFNTVNN